MERNPVDRNRAESSPEESSKDKPKKSKKSGAEAAPSPAVGKKEKAERDIGHSLSKMFELPKEKPADDKKEAGAKKPEKSQKAESDAEITNDELQHVQAEIASDHLDAISNQTVEVSDQLAPARSFLEEVQQGKDIDEAFREAAVDVGMDASEIEEALEVPIAVEDEPDIDMESVEVEPSEAVQAPEITEISTTDATEGDIDLNATGSVGGNTTGTTGGGSPSGAGSSGRGSATSGGGGGGSSGSSGGGPGGPTGSAGRPSGPGGLSGPTGANAMPIMPLPNRPPQAILVQNLPPATQEHFRSGVSRRMVVGAAVLGYLWGRRRGRIKTEKRLMPVQKKLQKEVKTLQKTITLREQQLVAAKARLQNEQPAVKKLERPQSVPEQAPIKLKSQQQSESVSDRKATVLERGQPSRTELRLGLEKPKSTERLAHMIVAAEAPRQRVTAQAERPLTSAMQKQAESVATLSRQDLLALSEKIVIEGATLKNIYESRLLGEKQLRHLVSEHLKGRDIRHALRKEMVEHEIDFERDPLMRDRVRAQAASGAGGVSQLLSKMGITDDSDETPQQQMARQQAERQAGSNNQSKQSRAMAETGMITAIVALSVLVAFLLLR